MAGKTIAEKLFLKEGYSFSIINAPDQYLGSIGEIPDEVVIENSFKEESNMIQLFTTSREELVNLIPKIKANLNHSGLLWITYPKGSSKVATDLNRDIIRKLCEDHGLKTVAMFSVDDIWSAMRLKII